MDFKDRMIEAYERGECTYEGSYDYVRDSYASIYDNREKIKADCNCRPICNCTCDNDCECKTPVDEGPTGIAAFKSARYS